MPLWRQARERRRSSRIVGASPLYPRIAKARENNDAVPVKTVAKPWRRACVGVISQSANAVKVPRLHSTTKSTPAGAAPDLGRIFPSLTKKWNTSPLTRNSYVSWIPALAAGAAASARPKAINSPRPLWGSTRLSVGRFSPHLLSAQRGCLSCSPYSVSSYTGTAAGAERMTFRTTPSVDSDAKRSPKRLVPIAGKTARRSLYRFGPSNSSLTTSMVQRSPSTSRARARGHICPYVLFGME